MCHSLSFALSVLSAWAFFLKYAHGYFTHCLWHFVQMTAFSVRLMFSFYLKWLLLLIQSRVCLFVTPWTVAHQAPLSSTTSWRLLKFISIELVVLFKLILYLFNYQCLWSFSCSVFSSSHYTCQLLVSVFSLFIVILFLWECTLCVESFLWGVYCCLPSTKKNDWHDFIEQTNK